MGEQTAGAASADERERAIERRATELERGVRLAPQQIADHFASAVFTGGPAARFEEVGRETLVALVRNGMYPHSSLLDIGSGPLRLGYWTMNFLLPDRYCGLEPDDGLTKFGCDHVVGPEVVAAKRPVFDNNMDFDLTVFGRSFDFYVARSIWSHTSKAQIRTVLDGFLATANERGVFLVSYVPADDGVGYDGAEWVNMPLVRHAIEWIAEECRARDLGVRQLPEVVNDQPWLRIERASATVPAGLTETPAPAPQRPRGLLARLSGR